MLPEQYRELFSVLAAKTIRNEVNWTRSVRTDAYVVSFASFGLSLYLGDDNDGKSFVLIKLINDQGRDADSFWIDETEADWDAAWQLFQGAKRKAHRIDLTLDKVLKELRQPGPVGEPPKPEETDDLPF